MAHREVTGGSVESPIQVSPNQRPAAAFQAFGQSMAPGVHDTLHSAKLTGRTPSVL